MVVLEMTTTMGKSISRVSGSGPDVTWTALEVTAQRNWAARLHVLCYALKTRDTALDEPLSICTAVWQFIASWSRRSSDPL